MDNNICFVLEVICEIGNVFIFIFRKVIKNFEEKIRLKVKGFKDCVKLN